MRLRARAEHLTYDAGEYAHAAELFTALGDYKNSAALAAQSGDKALAEKLLGSWVSNEMDVSSIFIDSLYDAIDDDESSKALLDCMDLGALHLKYTIEFTGEGTFLLAADSESAAAMIDTFYTAFTDGLTAYLEKEIEQDAANNGYTVEGLMQTYGCTTTRELIDAMLEMPLEDFMARRRAPPSMTRPPVRSPLLTKTLPVLRSFSPAHKAYITTPRPHFPARNAAETAAPDFHRPEFFGKMILAQQKILRSICSEGFFWSALQSTSGQGAAAPPQTL